MTFFFQMSIKMLTYVDAGKWAETVNSLSRRKLWITASW
jgi:hypothetical protein